MITRELGCEAELPILYAGRGNRKLDVTCRYLGISAAGRWRTKTTAPMRITPHPMTKRRASGRLSADQISVSASTAS
jgi:hypothetical protein